MRAIVVAASLLGLLLVAAGAGGGHGVVPVEALSRWQSAFVYGFAHTLAAILAAAMPFRHVLQYVAAWSFVLSVVLFSGVQIAKIMLGGIAMSPTPFDQVSFLVPAGGVAFIMGWLMLGLSALMTRSRHSFE